MIRRRAAAALCGAIALATALGGCAARISGSPRLEIDAPRWVLSSLPATLRVKTLGGISHRDVILTVTVNLKVVGTYPTSAGSVAIPISAQRLHYGRNSVFVKTGSEKAELEIFVVPLAVPAGLAALLLVALFVLRRRRAAG